MIHFEQRAVARLREQLGAAEEANQDLIAFARGHSGAVASIHAAALAALEASSVEQLLRIVTGQWPSILGIDAVAVGLLIREGGLRADACSTKSVEAAFIERMYLEAAPVEVRTVSNGHPLFGTGISQQIRAEALIKVGAETRLPRGLLVLGQRAGLELGNSHGSDLLLFLGRIVASTVRRVAAIC
ncbi:MAG TPA: DUF484 family protein [Sphingomicrobium sp.]|nr:DUF484 family protein [Sphingomicrobium sp.]